MYGIDFKNPDLFMDEKQKTIMQEVINLLKEKDLSSLEARFILQSARRKIKISAMHGKV